MEKILLLSMIVVAFITINTKILKNSVIYLAVFSVLGSFLFLIYNSPDVAIAEAVMGAAFTTVIFLVAIKKHKLIIIYFIGSENDFASMKKELNRFFQSKEREPEFRTVNTSINDLLKIGNCDYIVRFDEAYHILSVRDKVYFSEIKSFFERTSFRERKVMVSRYE